MGFIMEGLDAESYDRTYDDRGLIERILKYFKPQRRAMGLIVVMVVLNSAMDALLAGADLQHHQPDRWDVTSSWVRGSGGFSLPS